MRLSTILAAAALVLAGAPATVQAETLQQLAVAKRADEQVDPERLALAKQLLESMHAETMLQGMMRQLFASMPMVGGGSPKQSAELHQMNESMGAALATIMPDMVHAQAVVYAQTFSAQELKDAITFYSSPSGRALMAKLPEVTQRMMPAIWPLMPKLVDAWATDYCTHVKCDEAHRQMFAAIRERIATAVPAAKPGAQ
jgi:hypothetical protein